MPGDRIVALEAMLGRRPEDTRLRFGLALECLGAGRLEEGVRELRAYLDASDDEGNAWGRLGAALGELGREEEAREAYRLGIEAAYSHGHPTMALEFEDVLREWDGQRGSDGD
jgi:Flp pilus assembly protein TadD